MKMKSIFIKLFIITFCFSTSYPNIFSQSITGKIISKSGEGLRGTNKYQNLEFKFWNSFRC